MSDFRVTVDYQRQGRKVMALKFRIRRIALLPEAVTSQGTLFPDLEDMPVVVMELKDAGMSSQDAWDIWQHGFGFVDEAARPPADPREDADAAFVRYVREKIGLDHGVGHFRPLSITRQRHLLAYHFIAMSHEGLCQVF